MTQKSGGNNIKMIKNEDVKQPLRLPINMVKEAELVSESLNISKNDVYKIAIALFVSKVKAKDIC